MPEPAAIIATLMGQLNAAITNGPHTAGETDEIISSLLKTLPIMGQHWASSHSRSGMKRSSLLWVEMSRTLLKLF
jgi:hypothetical protein